MIKDEKDFTMLFKPCFCYIIILLGDFKEYLSIFYVSVFIFRIFEYIRNTDTHTHTHI